MLPITEYIYIVRTPINIVHGMWFGVERRNSSTWK
jgi:hypothetical protein